MQRQPAVVVRPALADRIAIGDLINGLAFYSDQGEWDLLEAGYAESVTTDYSSLFGGEPQTQPRSAVIASLRGVMPGFDFNQHLITTPDIQMRDEDHAVARSYVRATHRLGTSAWVVGGYYTHELERRAGSWRITYVKFTLGYEEGDRALLARAVERASSR
jgi:SnoaL-like domain